MIFRTTRNILAACLLSMAAIAQQPLGPLSGAQPKGFSNLPDNLGFLENSVNLFTGQVQFALPVMSFTGQGSLTYGVVLNYSSGNVANQMSIWNREAPTSTVGLGWSLEVPRIVADHKSTGTRYDDEFYLVEGGQSQQLFLISATGEYVTRELKNWKITYDTSTERWTIIKEDGTTYVYGDKNSGKKTVRYMVKWGNWIGNSSRPANQSQIVYMWDLSEIINIWSDKITFEYLQTEEYVAGDGSGITTQKMHTKASYIKEVKNLNNERITFSYINKTSVAGGIMEFKDPHNEQTEPDPYQEKFETLALDKVSRFDENGSLLTEVRFGYGFLGSGELAKRTLNSITQYNQFGQPFPGILFSYDSVSTNNFGALKTVTSPLKGTTSFTFSPQTLSRTSLEMVLPANTNYKEPRIFFGEDYVVITRRNVPSTHSTSSQPVIIDVLTWDGGVWVSNNVGYFYCTVSDAVVGTRKQDFDIAIGRDFFAVLPKGASGHLQIYKRNQDYPGAWHNVYNDYGADQTTVGTNPTLRAGDDFIFVGSLEDAYPTNFTYTWNQSTSTWSKQNHSKPSGASQFFYTVANNYFLVYQDTEWPQPYDKLSITFKTSGSLTPVWQTTTQQNLPATYGTSYFYGSNSYAVMMAVGGNERIYNFDENYVATLTDLGMALADNSFVNNVNNSMCFITDVNGPTGYAWRYDGVSWISSGTIDFYGPNIYLRNMFSLGDDFVFRPKPNGSSEMKAFNPATRLWTTALALGAPPNPYVLLAGHNFVISGGRFYFRNVDYPIEHSNAWTLDPLTVSSFNQTQSVGGDLFLQGGFGFVATGFSNSSIGLAVSFKNGALLPNPYTTLGPTGGQELIKERPGGSFNLLTSEQVSYNAIVTALGGVANLEDASSLKVYRKCKESLYGSISAYTVVRMDVSDGTSTRYVTYDYLNSSASTDVSGLTPQFNRVRLIPGSNFAGSKPYGYTNNYFLNGLSSSTVTSFDSNASIDESFLGNYIKVGTGAPYKALVYDYANALVATSTTGYRFTSVGPNFFFRSNYQSESIDQRSSKTDFVYDNVTGLLASKTSHAALSDPVVAELAYGTLTYSGASFIVPIRQFTYKDPSLPIGINGTRYKTWGGSSVPAPYQTYSWRSGNIDFSPYWNNLNAVPVSDWKLASTINTYDGRGLPLEVVAENGIVKSTIYHQSKPLMLAETTNAASNQCLYEGFEYQIGNTSTDVIAGLKSSTVVYTASPPSAGSFKLTYWQKPSGGVWALVTQTISSPTQIGGSGALIDEVRLLPAKALMTSYSYNAFGNPITSTDPNNRIIYYEYDEFNRLKFVRDEDKNIVRHTFTNVKN